MHPETKSCCFTGYRPEKFPFKFSADNTQYIAFENRLTQTIYKLCENGCHTFYSGMAMGFDIVAAECVLLSREVCRTSSIKLVCAVPFIEQSKSFPKEWQQRYNDILTKADEVILTSDKYFSSCYMRRNRFMVDNSDFVVTWFDGKSGGTKSTMDYARRLGRTVINLNTEYVDTNFTEYTIID